MCRGGRPRERGIEAQKAPYTGPDRLGSGFEPPLTGVSWVGLTALGGTQYERYDPPMRAHASRASVEFVPGLLEAAFYLASLVRTGSYPVSRFVPPLYLVALPDRFGPCLSPLLLACPGLGSRLWRCAFLILKCTNCTRCLRRARLGVQ
jgi:hypothetical protein